MTLPRKFSVISSMDCVILWPELLLFLTAAIAFCVIWTGILSSQFQLVWDDLIFFVVTLPSGWVVQYLNEVGHNIRIRQNSRARQDSFKV